jgi:hypothetical protein
MSDSEKVKKQALEELCTVANERDTYLRHFKNKNGNPLLEAMENMGSGQLSLLQIAAKTLSEFCACPNEETAPEFEFVAPALPTVARLILHEDDDLRKHAFSILTSLTHEGGHIDEVLKIVPLEHLVQLMSRDRDNPCDVETWFPFVQFMSNVVADTATTVKCIRAGILPRWCDLLFHPEPRFRSEACFALSNIAVFHTARTEILNFPEIIPRVVELIKVTFFAKAV